MNGISENERRADLIVVGGGMAGLLAANLVAREGRSVVLLERAGGLGGRAATHERQGVRFNLGAHALYCNGHAFRLLKALGIPFSGRFPSPGRPLFLGERGLHPIPQGLGSLLGSRLLNLVEKWRLARILASLPKIDARPLDRMPLGEWIGRHAGRGALSGALRALFRVSTYADDFARLSAGAAIDQLAAALAGNVWYLDGGWQTLVDGLRDRALAHGAEIRTGSKAESVRADGEGVVVRLAGGESLLGRAAIVADDPAEACRLLDLPADSALARWASARIPVRAACLDLALDGLPRPERRFALGLDRPLYYSVHSAAAKLAPEGVAVVHAMKYLGGGPEGPAGDVERELEAMLDRLQPGWRGRVVDRRFLPGMPVSHALPRADEAGLAGRPSVDAAGPANVFLAGDWVGGAGMLVDASAASAEEAARRVVEALGPPRVRPERRAVHAG